MREMSSITPEFGTCKQQDGAAGAEVEQAEYRAQSELRAVYGPATGACLGVLGLKPQPVPRTAVYGRSRSASSALFPEELTCFSPTSHQFLAQAHQQAFQSILAYLP